MRLEDFDYPLPKDLIAQTPVEPRNASRLLVLDCKSGEVAHRSFADIVDYFQAGDILVLNDSRVLPAKIKGRKTTGGKVELLLIKKLDDAWECLIKGRNIHPGKKLIFNELEAIVIESFGLGRFKVKFNCEISRELLAKIGSLPLPPYIKKELRDEERYQTIYGRVNGSLASTTAGLHFTPELLRELEQRGVSIVFITLHIGISTFLPVRDIQKHKMEAEYCRVQEETANKLNSAKGKIVAVGTTVVKALESACINGKIQPFDGFTDLFIYPGYEFKAKIDALITNFHLPRSTLLMLVCAYAGRERILRAYEEAIAQRYRFYSFGDAMLILK
ncbi:MAG: tRNA preQ1(34) S-adenosylmethionine ribosyltransferase-isomerase QueA [Methanocellales archaeon]